MTDEEKRKGVAEASAAGFDADRAPAKAPGGKGGPLKLKVRKIGNSLGVVLPKEVLAKLGAAEGTELTVADAPEGVVLSHLDEDILEQIEAGRRAMKRYRNALRELAK
ncbi:MAG: AbrB/MazE/SpoVT family DNA-binding domain-containing protein [Caulobacterales bacterium]